jgi:hypothetical protein
MGKRYDKLTDSFSAFDKDGKLHRITERTEYQVVESFGGKTEEHCLLTCYQTDDGTPVNKIDDDTFDILSPDIRTGSDTIRVWRTR